MRPICCCRKKGEMLQEVRVHHVMPEAILCQLGPKSGFGRATVASLGGDALAEKMFARLSKRGVILVTPQRLRDSDGYAPLHVDLLEAVPSVATYEKSVRELLCELFRKNMICDLGAAVSASLVKKTERGGCLLNIGAGLSAVSVDPFPAADNEPADARILDYGATVGVATVGFGATVDQAPRDPKTLGAIFQSYQLGAEISCTVLPAKAIDGKYVVVEARIAAATKGPTAMGYLLLADTSKKQTTLPVGSVVNAFVRFVPNERVQGILPFFVASMNSGNAGVIPTIKTTVPPSRMLISGKFPWRSEDISEADDTQGEEDRGRLRRRKIEEAIDAYEREKYHIPKSPEEFKKMLLASPNSSFLWTQYMAHHLDLNQVEEARNVAEKALKTIGVRETKELLNVWVAYMNLENIHGTAESLAAIFRRCLQHSDDQLIVHEKLAEIFGSSRKFQQQLSLCRAMSSKFRNEMRVWERLGTVLIDTNKRDQLKRFLKDVANALGKNDQCLVVEHLAVHEYKSGTTEGGRALFEGLVAKAPKKSDVWSVYLDQELSLIARSAQEASVTHVRKIFERLATLSFPPKVMQAFLTRYLTFEQAHGTPADVEKVKSIARAYVESRVGSTATNE